MRDSKPLTPRGFTLVEVIASVVILSMFLTTVLVAQSRHTRQIRKAAQIETAVRLTDRLMAKWFDSTDSIEPGQSQRFEEENEYWWRITRVPTRITATDWNVVTLKIEAFHENRQEALVSIEFITEPYDEHVKP